MYHSISCMPEKMCPLKAKTLSKLILGIKISYWKCHSIIFMYTKEQRGNKFSTFKMIFQCPSVFCYSAFAHWNVLIDLLQILNISMLRDSWVAEYRNVKMSIPCMIHIRTTADFWPAFLICWAKDDTSHSVANIEFMLCKNYLEGLRLRRGGSIISYKHYLNLLLLLCEHIFLHI